MKRSRPPRRTTELRADPETTRAWQRRSRRRIPRRSAARIAEDARTAELRARIAALPCRLRNLNPEAVGPCGGPGTPHHLQKASAGGSTTAANLVPLCARHNGWVEDEPLAARALGLVVCGEIDPAEAERRRIAARIEPL